MQGAGRQRRPRQHQLPAREVRAVRRPGRRRRRQRRQRLPARRRRASTRSPTFASSAPSRPSTASRAARNDCTGRGGDGPLRAGADRHGGARHRHRRAAGRSDPRGRELLVARGGKGGWGNQRFKSSTNRAPRQFGPGLPGEKRIARARTQGDRGRGPAGLAQCRQVHADPRRLGGAAEGRGLSVHDAAPEPGRGRRRRASQLRHGRHSRD